MPYVCDDCNKSYVWKKGLVKHITTQHKLNGKEEQNEILSRRRLQYFDQSLIPESLPEQENLWPPPSREQLLADGYDEASLGVIRENWRFIATNYRQGRILNRFNVRLRPGSFDMANVTSIIRGVHSLQTRGYKLNLTWGCLLYHQTEKRFRYFWGGNSSSFNLFYPVPIAVNKTEDLESQLKYLDQSDLVEFISQCRTDTKWVLHSVLNLVVLVYSADELAAPLMGGHDQNFALIAPKHLKSNRFVLLQLKHTNGTYYKDGLCFFRALAVYFANGSVAKFQAKAKSLAKRFWTFVGIDNGKFSSRNGIEMDDLLSCEKCFEIRIFVYSIKPYNHGDGDAISSDSESRGLLEGNNEMCAVLVRKSMQKLQKNGDLYLDLSSLRVESSGETVEHLSWISSICHYCKRFYCPNCGYTTPKRSNHKRHVVSCESSKNKMRARCPKSAAYNPPVTSPGKLAAGMDIELPK